MPKYFYKCLSEKCEQVFEAVHSMKEKLDTCLHCSGNVERVPMNTVNVFKGSNNEQTKQKTGSVVNKSIEEFKQDLKDEKKRLREIEYK
jgi:putative FmdB family regulatory protein